VIIAQVLGQEIYLIDQGINGARPHRFQATQLVSKRFGQFSPFMPNLV
jgi:hypothetical protein